jgi:excisionase family DNA binding protein
MLQPKTEPRFFTVQQASDYCGLSEGSLRERIQRGRIPVTRVGRTVLIPKAELDGILLGGGSSR